MACLTADGALTGSGRRILTALDQPSTAEEIAGKASLPLYRVRSALRELSAAGLAEEIDSRFDATDDGRARLRG